MPQAAKVFAGEMHAPFVAQQPLAQFVALQGVWPEFWHVPLLQVWFVPQALQAPPPVPQEEVSVPAWQSPEESQQPPQLLESQVGGADEGHPRNGRTAKATTTTGENRENAFIWDLAYKEGWPHIPPLVPKTT